MSLCIVILNRGTLTSYEIYQSLHLAKCMEDNTLLGIGLSQPAAGNLRSAWRAVWLNTVVTNLWVPEPTHAAVQFIQLRNHFLLLSAASSAWHLDRGPPVG